MSYPSSIEHDLLSSFKEAAWDEKPFNTLSLEVFEHQFQHNAPYRNYCEILGKSPTNICHWHDIPAVPTDAFKMPHLPIISFPPEKITRTFLTSGTTSETKGQHHFPTLALYEKSIVEGWRVLDLPRPRKAIFLTPTPEDAPHSSLSHMMSIVSHTYAESCTWALDSNGKLNLNTLQQATEGDEPVALLGTAIAFLHLFEQLDGLLPLPAGSWAMETGGYKGTRRSMTKENLYALFEEKLNLDPDSIVNEYSMTELSSQFYTRGLGGEHTGPCWTRTRVINPHTETDALPGEPGHLVIYDLANLHSVMALRTQDIAIAGSDNSFTLLGRDPSALPRGCSRATDYTL